MSDWVRHKIRVIVQVGEDVGSVSLSIEGAEDAFEGMDFGDLAEVAARALAAHLTGSDEEEDEDEEDVMMLPDFEDDDDGNHTLN
jgi:hypothetical protein